MRELLPKPIIIPGNPLSRANINLDYRLAKVPFHKIKNPTLAAKKLRWDKSNQWKDEIAWGIKAITPKIVPASPDKGIGILMDMVFKYKSGEAHKLRTDMDNVEKGIYDALEMSGIIPNDKQIIQKMIGKRVDVKVPRLVIYSIVEIHHDLERFDLYSYWSDIIKQSSLLGISRILPLQS